MSRLYIRTHSDTNVKPKTATANQECQTLHNWGSANDSNVAVRVQTYWPKGHDKPKVTIEIGHDVAYEVYGPEGQTLGLSR